MVRHYQNYAVNTATKYVKQGSVKNEQTKQGSTY